MGDAKQAGVLTRSHACWSSNWGVNSQKRVSRSAKPRECRCKPTKHGFVIKLLSSCHVVDKKLQSSCHRIKSICKVAYAWQWRPLNSGLGWLREVGSK